MTWPQGPIPFAVDELVALAQLEQGKADRGEPVDRVLLESLVRTLGAYVDGLPDAVRAATSRRLVGLVTVAPRYQATVAPKAVARR